MDDSSVSVTSEETIEDAYKWTAEESPIAENYDNLDSVQDLKSGEADYSGDYYTLLKTQLKFFFCRVRSFWGGNNKWG